jgi:MFS superfamily sulfate permease-like transporter
MLCSKTYFIFWDSPYIIGSFPAPNNIIGLPRRKHKEPVIAGMVITSIIVLFVVTSINNILQLEGTIQYHSWAACAYREPSGLRRPLGPKTQALCALAPWALQITFLLFLKSITNSRRYYAMRDTAPRPFPRSRRLLGSYTVIYTPSCASSTTA